MKHKQREFDMNILTFLEGDSVGSFEGDTEGLLLGDTVGFLLGA